MFAPRMTFYVRITVFDIRGVQSRPLFGELRDDISVALERRLVFTVRAMLARYYM